MSLEDLTPSIVTISLFLKFVFLSIIITELALPRIRKTELSHSWSTSWESEMQSALVEGSAFLFSIGLLLVFDIVAIDESWIPAAITYSLDIILIVLILYFLFHPKRYGIVEEGIYREGLVLKWDHIVSVEPSKKKLAIKAKGFMRENRTYPLPEDEDMREKVVSLLKEKLGKPSQADSEGKDDPAQSSQ